MALDRRARRAQRMLRYPNLDPIALHVGPIEVHWYGLMYLFGIVLGWWLLHRRLYRLGPGWNDDRLLDLAFYAVLGVVIGGRIGYVLFYNLPYYAADPVRVFEVWDGGMSFHGGLLGVVAAMALFARKVKTDLITLTDFIAPVVPLGLMAGRIGNFINGELWGKVSYTIPWAMRLPCSEPRFFEYCGYVGPGWSAPYQPSQLYEMVLEGIVLFVVLFTYSRKPRPPLAVSGLFALLYGVFRIAVEFIRLPDPQLGYLAFGWLTMGQLLSIPMVIVGAAMLALAYRKGPRAAPAA
jgi:phosphatidylglycerol:prolipoprotein diacylglycerol transferase